MSKKLLDFARSLNLPLCAQQVAQLEQYAQCIWEKKEMLNLTSVADRNEILLRHICDGLQGAALVRELAARREMEEFSLLDAGSGAGYIGLTMAVALPAAQVMLVESLERRCAFLNWAVMRLGVQNVAVKRVRLGEDKQLQADFVTERAMGPLEEIFPVCWEAVKPGGAFVAYQGASAQAGNERSYTLPWDEKERFLVVFEKNEK